MAYDHRSNDPRDLDAQDLAEMTRNFLAKGGNIVQCPPGASENVVYRKGGFRRRAPNDAKAAADKPADVNAPEAGTAEAGSKEAGPAAPETTTEPSAV
ncbi:hypothetical protein [Azospirillum ramasamyi]|uniref:Uncharacterized protein n=1 Tax=Azospirillum ramasamyi TaxID=682998 RepID=A0A2U9S237_9PROT|nr:hypothetical protein [Azospirillum ramasamyi]AWU93705.1 hypothetical protein DM194_05195 [Azospirillum ramasamyi]